MSTPEPKVAAPVGGVDVLAVMDEAQRVLGEVHFKYQRQIGPFATQALASTHRLPKARAAVAELVASATEAAKQLRAMGETGHSAHLSAAIARVQGGAA